MQIIRSTGNYNIPDSGTCITVGTFDGVHTGHTEILRFLKSIAGQNHLPSLVFTFTSHPRFVLNKDAEELKLLTTPDEKQQLLENSGVDFFFEQDFTEQFAKLSASEFVVEILIKKLGMKSLVVGHDHLFGKNREGNFALLQKLSTQHQFSLHQIPAVSNAGFNVSSTKIRNLLSDGDVALANEMLGYNYSFSGEVIQGFGIGRELGFPTANINRSEINKMLPAAGVYIIKAMLDNEIHDGLLNIGTRPTFNGNNVQIEAHLFDFDKIIYGEKLKIEFLLFLRPELKFESKNELVLQIRKDRDKALQYFGRIC
ncbi:MAG: riboflavin biosynthesis protein RibF [Bacteroidetes bacterium HGW-Bacteroidetes-6]|jgi:riboflavin kinase/FMN adenylyltransferase|nr:MAG: riboflavin biosynthesis protein RibF [Bacteroidetes bacterium HGW-Bacteroidetes-6]